MTENIHTTHRPSLWFTFRLSAHAAHMASAPLSSDWCFGHFCSSYTSINTTSVCLLTCLLQTVMFYICSDHMRWSEICHSPIQVWETPTPHTHTNKLSEGWNHTKACLMRAVGPVRLSNMKAKLPFVSVSDLRIVQHEYSLLQWINSKHAEPAPLGPVLMFKTYAANKPSMYYTTKSNGN